MDKLGCSAAQNISVVVRQTIFNGHYGLLDFRNFDPYPVNWGINFSKFLIQKQVDIYVVIKS